MSNIIETGAYNVRNVKQQAVATLPDANDGTPIVAGHSIGTHDVNETAKWNVIRLSNGRYSIQNVGSARYANVGPRAAKASIVEGRSRSQQWVIRETRVVNQFTIAATDTGHFWHLVDGEEGTSVTVQDVAADQRSWWILEKAT